MLPSMYSKYFVNCLWTFIFVPTRKPNATKIHCYKGVGMEMLLVLKEPSFEKNNVECFEDRNM